MAALAALALAYILSHFYRSFLAVIAPELATSLDLSAQDLGNISAAWFMAFALAQFPVGIALDKLGPRRTVSTFMSAAIVGGLLFAMAPEGPWAVWALIGGMVLVGIGCAPVLMGAMMVFARNYHPSRFATLSSAMIGIGSLGNLAGATPLAWAAAALGWRGAMLGVTAITVVSLILIWFYLPRRTEAEKQATHPETLLQTLGGVFQVLKLRTLWAIFPVTFCAYATIASLRGLWAGPYLDQVFNLDPVPRGDVLLGMALAMAIGAFIFGPLDKLLDSRKKVAAAGNLLCAASLGGLALWPDDSVVLSAALLMSAGGFGMTYAVLMAHGRAFVPAHLTGRGITLLNFFSIGGVSIFQILSGNLVEQMRAAGTPAVQIYSTLNAAFAIVLALSVVIYLFSRDAKPSENSGF